MGKISEPNAPLERGSSPLRRVGEVTEAETNFFALIFVVLPQLMRVEKGCARALLRRCLRNKFAK